MTVLLFLQEYFIMIFAFGRISEEN